MEQTAINISAALEGARRRERLLQKSQQKWSWSDLAVTAGLFGAMIVMAVASPELSTPTLGSGFIIAIGVWHYRRLQARVDALARLVGELEPQRDI